MLHAQKRRATRSHRELDYTMQELRAWAMEGITHRAGAYCQGPLTEATFRVDHATAVSRGGSFHAGNLAFCCAPCNEAKGVLDADEFTALWQLVRGWDERPRTSLLARLRAGGKAIRR